MSRNKKIIENDRTAFFIFGGTTRFKLRVKAWVGNTNEVTVLRFYDATNELCAKSSIFTFFVGNALISPFLVLLPNAVSSFSRISKECVTRVTSHAN